MLEHLNHPFLCNLRYSFQDIEYMYVRRPTAPYPNRGTDDQYVGTLWWT